MVMQVVVSGAHIRRVPTQFSGATPISIPRGSNESGTPPGCKTPPAPLPGGRRPKKPSATSGYRLANPSGCRIQNIHTPGRAVPALPGVWAFSEANPEGCQRVAGGRSGQRGERPPEKRVGWLSTPERGARPNEATIGWLKSLGPQSKCLGSISGTHGRRVPAQFSGVTPISIPRGSNESGTPPGCKTPPAPLPGGRRPKKPSATSGYRLANPSGCLRKPPYRPGRTAAVSRVLQTDSQ
jgi:hypothetical protein